METIHMMTLLVLIAIEQGFKYVGRIFPRTEQATLEYDEWRIDFCWRDGTIWFHNPSRHFVKKFEAPFDFECLAQTIYAITGTELPEEQFREDILHPFYNRPSFLDNYGEGFDDDGGDDDGDDGGGGGGGGDINNTLEVGESN
jgi:hypothetical protein